MGSRLPTVLLSAAFSLCAIAVPIVIIILLASIRRELRRLNERQRATTETQDELNRRLAALADSLSGLQRDAGADQRPEATNWNVLASPGEGTAGAASPTTLLSDPEIAEGARDVRRI
ncbi:MAG: hypothetical protein LCH96_01225 [Actinobacteria bacterium]|nr:hypothetical protein [Actinomycetota bacterium]